MEEYWESLFKEKYDIESNLNIPENDLTVNMKDYLNQARNEMLAELTKGQEEAFKRYEMIKDDLREIIVKEKLLILIFP